MTRRDLLLTASAATRLAAAVAPIPIGVLGAAHSHAREKLRLLAASPEWRVVGVAEPDPALRAELTRNGLPLADREALLRNPEVKAIAVESDPADHAADGLAVVRAGKHLHLEKAPAHTLEGFREILRVAKEKSLLVQTGYMWRYHPGVDAMLEAARKGWLGEIYLVKASIGNQLAPDRRSDWARFRGGIMFELGGHVIDPLARLLGRPDRVTPMLRNDGQPGDKLADNTAAIFEWPRVLGMVQSAALQPGSSRYRSIEFHGRNGSAVLQPIEPGRLEIHLDRAAGPYAKGTQPVPLPAYRRYEADLADFAAALRGERALKVTPEEDWLVHETILRASGMA